ncbi:MAG: FkbM family methyltransferase [Hyphomicrobiaceae bacterium]|nr:FkbM family methyltransferase [Hyphomicrobiaceae bacterium]
MAALKKAVKELAGSLGYDVIRKNGGGTADLTRGVVARFRKHGQDIALFVDDEWDYIQGHHLKGHFYEEEELGLIGRHLRGGVLVDVGANIGNHTVYALKLLGVDKVIAFEPNPAAARLLQINLALNGLSGKVDHRLAGLSDRSAVGQLVAPGHKDLGSTRVTVGGGASAPGDRACRVMTGDEALAGEPRIDMIKIDTEAMELKVLAGLQHTLERHRPKLFVEVDDANRATFLALAQRLGYEVADSHRRYATNCNYLLTPRS